MSDLPGEGIEHSRDYAVKVLTVEEPFQSEEWQEIRSYKELRDKIAYTESRLVSQRDEPLVEYVRKHPLLLFGIAGEVVIEKGFCEEVIQTVIRFSKQLPETWDEFMEPLPF